MAGLRFLFRGNQRGTIRKNIRELTAMLEDALRNIQHPILTFQAENTWVNPLISYLKALLPLKTAILPFGEVAFLPIPAQVVNGGTGYLYAVQAQFPPGLTPTWTAVNLPPGLAINAVTGVISGTPPVGVHTGSPYTTIISLSVGPAILSQTVTFTATN